MTNTPLDYADALSERMEKRSAILEEIHLNAAIDFQLSEGETADPREIVVLREKSSRSISNREESKGGNPDLSPEELEYLASLQNPEAVANSLSPFVPSSASVITGLMGIVDIHVNDVLLDIGSGDGRVCISVAATTGCECVGLDVSPPCITLAKSVAREEGVEDKCTFYELGTTQAALNIFEGKFKSPDSNVVAKTISDAIKGATVVFLFVTPGLLTQLVWLIERLMDTSRGGNGVRAVVTQTYHFNEEEVEFTVADVDTVNDLKLYTSVKMRY
jgi:hypothetical protein